MVLSDAGDEYGRRKVRCSSQTQGQRDPEPVRVSTGRYGLLRHSFLSGIFRHCGQSNYASANNFIDAFVQFRQSRGLAASTIDLGVVNEIGCVSRNASAYRHVVQQMSAAISEESLLNYFAFSSRPLNLISQPVVPTRAD
ncbi:hypothetical protein F5Y10DRAFT_263874 [Nemania abortiva]|nr:hypothetical protein F5Y10DRAFT_263874 [Nemania abortiva]